MKVLKYTLIGILVAIGGILYSIITINFFDMFVHKPTGNGSAYAIGTYIVIVVVICTGIILDKIKGDKDE